MNMLVSVLQESPPFYALENFPDVPAMKDALNLLQQLVLLAFVRLVTNKESPNDFMQPVTHGNLLYDEYIFTVAILWDLCQLYGRENRKTVERIVRNLFKMQPLYKDDLEKSVSFLVQVRYDGEIVNKEDEETFNSDIQSITDFLTHLNTIPSLFSRYFEASNKGSKTVPYL